MPDPLDYLSKKKQLITEQFRTQYPELYSKIQQENLLSVSGVPVLEQKREVLTPEKKIFAQFSLEEHQSILEKMREIVRLPAGQLDAEFELYLEQQLSDMLGFSITSELNGQRLLHSHGTIKSLPHTKRYPNDSASDHETVLEAPFSAKRSVFGWLNPSLPKNETSMLEKFGVSLPLFHLSNWAENYQKLKEWYRYRTVVLINPIESCAVVAAVTDVFTASANKYQLGGTPELIRAGKFWSPQASGKTLIFFVAEDENPPLGPITLEYKH